MQVNRRGKQENTSKAATKIELEGTTAKETRRKTDREGNQLVQAGQPLYNATKLKRRK